LQRPKGDLKAEHKLTGCVLCMSFSLEPLDTDLTFLVEHHLIERIIELDADHAKGTPIFIEP